jgi:hypothetical protein
MHSVAVSLQGAACWTTNGMSPGARRGSTSPVAESFADWKSKQSNGFAHLHFPRRASCSGTNYSPASLYKPWPSSTSATVDASGSSLSARFARQSRLHKLIRCSPRAARSRRASPSSATAWTATTSMPSRWAGRVSWRRWLTSCAGDEKSHQRRLRSAPPRACCCVVLTRP